MYYVHYVYPYHYPYYINGPSYTYAHQPNYRALPYEIDSETSLNSFYPFSNERAISKDQGMKPFVININEATKQNNTYRTAVWTGAHLQITLMSINAGDDIGLEIHPNVDQFLRIEQGQGIVQMGKSKDNLSFQKNVYDDYAIMIPAGTWHNVTNTGKTPLKLYSIYAPPNHPFGTLHITKADALAAEEGSNH